MSRVVVLEAEFVNVLQSAVDAQHFLNHAHLLLAAEVPSVHVEDFPLLDQLWGQHCVFQQHSAVLLVRRMFEAHLEHGVRLAHHFRVVIEGLAHNTLAQVLQAPHFVAITLHQVRFVEAEGMSLARLGD